MKENLSEKKNLEDKSKNTDESNIELSLYSIEKQLVEIKNGINSLKSNFHSEEKYERLENQLLVPTTSNLFNDFKKELNYESNRNVSSLYNTFIFSKLILTFLLILLMPTLIKRINLFNACLGITILLFVINSTFIQFYVLPYSRDLRNRAFYTLNGLIDNYGIDNKKEVAELIFDDSRDIKAIAKSVLKSILISGFLALVSSIPIFIEYLYNSNSIDITRGNEFASIVIFLVSFIISILIDIVCVTLDLKIKYLFIDALHGIVINETKKLPKKNK
ncbi:MAG: hypothetical protein E7H32_06960 [Anaerococcus sp.]|uniref:hypothetical protein n=1 Tax=Anaerococcus sp. TaxID=1872515 RepID=UPI00290D4E5A|nr:hypothetical protein [Anaerococcus sp.]MDU4026400.1 hypothetical protein [Anaerococcus sp.]